MKTENQGSLTGRNLVVVETGGDWFKLAHVTQSGAGATVRRIILRKTEEVEPLYGSGFLAAIGAPELKGLPAVVCLPRQAVNVRLFDLPSGDPGEIADMIDLQIARQTPYTREEIVFDYRLVDADTRGYTRVFLAIAQAGLVRQKLRCLEDSGFPVARVTVTTDGWLSALEAEGGGLGFGNPEPVVYLDVDSPASDLLVARKGVPLFSRSLSVGLRDLAANREKAEGDMVQQVTRAMETFRNENPGSNAERLMLFGPAGKVAGLASRLQEGLAMTVTPAAGVARMEGTPDVPQLEEVSVSGMLGAATRAGSLQMDLMPESMRLRKAVTIKARRLTLCAALVMVILAQAALWVGSHYGRRAAYLADLGRMLEATESAADSVETMRRKVALVAARFDGRMIPVKALAELHSVAAKPVSFTSIEFNDNRQVVCRGTADAVADVVRLVNAMEASPLFVNVKSARTAAGSDKTEFEVTGDIEEGRR